MFNIINERDLLSELAYHCEKVLNICLGGSGPLYVSANFYLVFLYQEAYGQGFQSNFYQSDFYLRLYKAAQIAFREHKKSNAPLDFSDFDYAYAFEQTLNRSRVKNGDLGEDPIFLSKRAVMFRSFQQDEDVGENREDAAPFITMIHNLYVRSLIPILDIEKDVIYLNFLKDIAEIAIDNFNSQKYVSSMQLLSFVSSLCFERSSKWPIYKGLRVECLYYFGLILETVSKDDAIDVYKGIVEYERSLPLSMGLTVYVRERLKELSKE
ncbi:MAG: hypothetical protein AAGC93_09450 [Cyanobacteria bacterium P01_F01_bin.53]